jgi:lycopene cyclase domain-containing protein
MGIARHGAGPTAGIRALGSQVHPVFMLPPLAASVFGALLAATTRLGATDAALAPVALGVHLVAVFFGLYTAHLKDGYVDFHRRNEDEDHPLTARGCRLALAGSTAGFAVALAAVVAVAGPFAGLLTLPGWVIGYLHAPEFDTNPVTVTAGYPSGVALALLSGFYVQAGTLSSAVVAFAGVFLVSLCGVKIIDDATDVRYDRSIEKRTVAVVLGPRRAREVAFGLLGLGMFLVVAFAVDGLFPASAVLAVVPFVAVAAFAARADPELATKLLIRGAYLFLAVLVAAIWFRPLAGVPLPDIGVLGGYAYLATEVAFGAGALVLLWRADAWWRVARTVAVLYPLAYLWDWYTLEVGVFAIPLRTGVELLGIPLEEHLFMLVVPAFAIGVHELLNGSTGEAPTGD